MTASRFFFSDHTPREPITKKVILILPLFSRDSKIQLMQTVIRGAVMDSRSTIEPLPPTPDKPEKLKGES